MEGVRTNVLRCAQQVRSSRAESLSQNQNYVCMTRQDRTTHREDFSSLVLLVGCWEEVHEGQQGRGGVQGDGQIARGETVMCREPEGLAVREDRADHDDVDCLLV